MDILVESQTYKTVVRPTMTYTAKTLRQQKQKEW